MATTPRFLRVTTLGVMAATWAIARDASGSNEREFTVSAPRVISSPTNQEIHVVAPDAKGTWPVVFALHGLRGTGDDMVELGTRLASTGAVVFAPTYNTDLTTADGLAQATDDIVCALPVGSQDRPRARRRPDPTGHRRRLVGSEPRASRSWEASKGRAENHVELIELPAANHFAPIFHDLQHGRWQVITGDPAGDQVVSTIVDAIAARANASAN